MKIINKSGKEECSSEESFYIILVDGCDEWEDDVFYFEHSDTFTSEAAAIESASPGDAIAKVTLVAKIV